MCIVAVCIPSVVLFTAGSAAAASTINLGTAAAASVLAGTGVTNTGPSVLALDLDTSPTPAITGFPPGTVVGTTHAADAVAAQAQSDLTTAYNTAAGLPSTSSVTGVDLGGMTLTSGVYKSTSGISITGTIPLTLRGDASSVFVFQAASTLVTGSASSVVLSGGVSACNVFWQVGSSATLGTTTTFVGNILALTSITVTTGVTVAGRALARNGAVTLDSDTFTSPGCGNAPPTTTPPVTTPPVTTPPVTTPPVTTPPVTTPPTTTPPTTTPPTTTTKPTSTKKPCPTTKPAPPTSTKKPCPTTKPAPPTSTKKPCPTSTPKPAPTTKPCPPKRHAAY